MSWQESLIRISNYEIETLQRRLADVVERRSAAEMRLVMMTANAEVEIVHADSDAQAGWYRAGFLQSVRARRTDMEGQIAALYVEEAGARDALSEAFESLKKFEHVAETARVALVKAEARREAIALDDLGARKRAM